MLRNVLAGTFIACAGLPLQGQVAPSEPQPDVAILATVRATILRHHETPRVSVAVRGSVNGQPGVTVSKTDRTNLPDQVQPHVTYRDIGIRLTITSTLPNIEQILDEALGPQSRTTAEPAPKTPDAKPTNPNP